MPAGELAKLKVADLKDLLKAKGLNTAGRKEELIQRLVDAEENGGPADADAGAEAAVGVAEETAAAPAAATADEVAGAPTADASAAATDAAAHVGVSAAPCPCASRPFFPVRPADP